MSVLSRISKSIRIGWQDKRLVLPSLLIVVNNIVFILIISWDCIKQIAGSNGAIKAQPLLQAPSNGILPGPTHGLISTPTEPGNWGFVGWESLSGVFATENLILVVLVAELLLLWWLINRFLEGITIALVYKRLSEGKGTGRFPEVCFAVFRDSLLGILVGTATFVDECSHIGHRPDYLCSLVFVLGAIKNGR